MLAGGAQDLPWNRERSGELLSVLSAAACNRCLVTSLLFPAPMSPRQQKYRREWEEANPWLDTEVEFEANCKACQRTFSVLHGGL